MKVNDIFTEMLEIAKRAGINVRNDKGRFQSNWCILNEQKLIIFNKSTPIDIKASVLARCLKDQNIDGIYIKPVVREFIEKEIPVRNIDNMAEIKPDNNL